MLRTPNSDTSALESGRPARTAPENAVSGHSNYERLYLDEINDALDLIARAEDYRTEYNTLRPHEALAWNRPLEVHLGLADPTIPTSKPEKILPTT